MNINDPFYKKDAPPPESGKDSYTRDRMQEIAQSINELIPAKWGFLVIVFPFGDEPGRMNYASNAKREDVLKLLHEFIEKAERTPLSGHQ